MKLIVCLALIVIIGHIGAGRRFLQRKSTSLVGRPDGHDGQTQAPFGRPDGHDGQTQAPFGRDDGHELSGKWLIGRPDGHDAPIRDLYETDEALPEQDEYQWEKDEPLVRCKRPHCDESLSCRFGPQTDVNGCPVCQCLEDPCIEEKCEIGYECMPLECPEHGPCKKLEASCKKKHCDGPQPMCATYCPLGYRLNERGCMTCTCRDPANLHNLTSEGRAAEDEEKGEEDSSSSSEDEGEEDDYYEDEDSLIVEDLDEHLREEMDRDAGREDGKPGALGEMCEGTRCRLNEICRSDWKYPGDSENERTNRICMIKTRCWAVANEPRLYPDHGNPDRRQACDSSLTFEPLQCMGYNPNIKNKTKTCWCTNDLGYVIDGTFTVIYAEEQKPICERNTTISATISMKFKILDRGTSDKTIVGILNEELSRITFAPKGSVKIISVDYPTLQTDFPTRQKQDAPVPEGDIGVNFILANHPDYDLPYALDLLFNVRRLRLDSDMYLAELSEKPRVIHYQFSSPPAPTVGDEDDTDLAGLEPLPHFHPDERIASRYHDSFLSKTLVIVCLVVLSVLILVVLTIIMILARRNCGSGHIRHHQLQNQISVAIDPVRFPYDKEQLLSDPSKNESVVLVTDDVLSKVKDSSIA